VHLWRTDERSRWRELRPEARECFAACFSPDGKELLLGQDDGLLTLWSIAREEEVARLAGHEDRVNSACWIGERVWSAGFDGTVREWDTATSECVRVLEGHPRNAQAAVDPGAGVVASGDGDGLLLIRDLEGNELGRGEHPASIQEVALAAGGRPLTCCYDGRLRLFERNGVLRYELAPAPEHLATAYGLAVSPDGRRAASLSMDCTLRVWDLEGGAPLNEREILGPAFAVAWSPDGRWLLSGARNGALRLWPVA
jgi:WD40 repeat protein